MNDRLQDKCSCGDAAIWGSLATEADRAAWLAEHAACPPKQEPEKTDYVTVPHVGLDTAAEAGVSVVAPTAEHVFLKIQKPSDHPDWCVCVKCKPKAA